MKTSRLVGNLIILSVFLILYFYSLQKFSTYKNIENFVLETEAPLYLFNLLVLIGLIFVFRKSLFEVLKKLIPVKVWKYAATVFLLALILRITLPPRTSRVMFDGDIYLDMGKQILLHGQSCLCDYGNNTQCFKCELMKWPVGHPFLLAMSFLIFGIGEQTAFNTIAVVSALSTFFVFLAAYLIFRSMKIAFFSSLILALLPVHILWSTTLSADITLSFSVAVTLFLTALCWKTNNIRIHAITLVALALLAQAKTEGVILIPLFFFTQLFNPKYLNLLAERRYIFMILVLFFFLSSYFVHTTYEWKVNNWGSSNKKFGIGYLKSNVNANLRYWFEMDRFERSRIYDTKQLYHPVGFTILSIISVIYGLIKKNKEIVLSFIWLVVLFLLYVSFYAGSVYYGVDVRYVLPQYIPFSLLAGYGLFSIHKELKLPVVFLVILLLVYFTTYFWKIHIPAKGIEEGSDARLYRQFAINFASREPDTCYFVSHVTSIYSWLGKGHMQIWYVNSPEFDKVVKSKKCLIFDQGYWCNLAVSQAKSCDNLKKYKLVLLQSLNDTKHEKIYSFYRVIAS